MTLSQHWKSSSFLKFGAGWEGRYGGYGMGIPPNLVSMTFPHSTTDQVCSPESHFSLQMQSCFLVRSWSQGLLNTTCKFMQKICKILCQKLAREDLWQAKCSWHLIPSGRLFWRWGSRWESKPRWRERLGWCLQNLGSPFPLPFSLRVASEGEGRVGGSLSLSHYGGLLWEEVGIECLGLPPALFQVPHLALRKRLRGLDLLLPLHLH